MSTRKGEGKNPKEKSAGGLFRPRAFLVCMLIGCGLCALVLLRYGIPLSPFTAQTARGLSDGFFVAAVLLLGVGTLVTIASATDFFDIFTYGFRSVLLLFTPLKKPGDVKRFYDYKRDRQGKRRPGGLGILLAGVLHLALAAVFWALYYRIG